MPQNRFNSKIVVQLLLLGLLFVFGLNYQYILDRYALATFRPTPEVAAIIDHLMLTPKAMGIMARSQPQIDNKAAFNVDCQTSKGEFELGCYVNGRIYVLKIDNASLASEMDVVMAHELLHASYARLGGSSKAEVNGQLEAAFSKINDTDLRQRMDDYAKSEPGQQDNELHSILGTEFGSLGPVLEAHYSVYFKNRSAIVAAQTQYQNVFESQRRSLDSDLTTIRALKAQLTALNHRMDGLKNSGSIAAYNTLVPQQNSLVDTINKRIASYQQAVDEYNALSKSLDSQQITGPAESTVH